MRLLLAKIVARTINLPVAQNIEYLIYRATLATYETSRVKVSLANLREMLIFIEDKDFYRHSGFSYKAIGRSLLSIVKIKRRSGGSTIHQQLIRTLFILDLNKTIRRKIIEILLAPWLNKVLEKNQILEIYLSSVRFDNGYFGVISAMKHFFNKVISNPTPAQAFFLIERVSNIRKSLLTNKIIVTVRGAKIHGILSETDIYELCHLYKDAIKDGKIIDHNKSIDNLITQLTS